MKNLLKREVVGGSAAVALILAATVAAGCGSDGNRAVKASTTAAGSPVSNDGLQRARAVVEKATAAATPIDTTTPLSRKPDAGKSIYYIQCGAPACKFVGDSLEQVAGLLKWKLTRVDSGLTPEKFAAAYTRALNDKPDGVIGAPVPRALIGKFIDGLAAAKIPYIELAEADPVGNGIVARTPGVEEQGVSGEWMADWIIADSVGKANVAYFHDAGQRVFVNALNGYQSEMKKNCAECKLEIVKAALADSGTRLPAQVVSYVQAHPDVDYVSMAIGDMAIGVPAALKAAGLGDRVKIVSRVGSPPNFQNIAKNDVEYATVGESLPNLAFQAFDGLARSFNGDPLDCCNDAFLSMQLLTRENVGDPAKPFQGASDIAGHFSKLWHLDG